MNKVPYTYANKGSKSMENSIIHSLTSISWQGAFLVFLIENVVIFILVIVIGNLITSRFSLRPVCLPPPALTPAEISVWLINVCLNTLITLAGWHLWKNGIIQFRDGINLRSLIDVIVLLLVMDGLMYALHRLAHISFLFLIFIAITTVLNDLDRERYSRLIPSRISDLAPFGYLLSPFTRLHGSVCRLIFFLT